MANLRIDINNDNFNNLFARYAEKLTEAQKELLPKELNYKLFKKGGSFRAAASVRLSFLTKLYVLLRCFKMNWVLLIEDDNGIGPEQYFKLREQCREEGFGVDPAGNWLDRGMFALANKELIEGFSVLNRLSVSPAYNYVSRVKNMPQSRTTEWKKHALYITQFLSNYDGSKKKIIMRCGVSVPELYTLFFLYDGTEKAGSEIYNEKFKYAYNSNRRQIQSSFITLENKGLISKNGKKRGMKLTITPQGIATVDDILHKYLINF